ncbi:MAG: arsinothricin resistance N-acetyltransferase ArsN1 family A [Candidatus Baltobacteraceae bacterium]
MEPTPFETPADPARGAILPASSPRIRGSHAGDLAAIRDIYNQGIEERIATLDQEPMSEDEIREWYLEQHDDRYAVLVAERAGRVAGWASLNPYSHRCAYRGVADLSVYVSRDARGSGVGTALLRSLEAHARRHEFHKIVLFALAINEAGLRLYRKSAYREVGVFREQGRLDGRFVDVIAMEKVLGPD